MKETLGDIFNQAMKDNFSVKIVGNGYQSVILYGIKIIKDDSTGDVIILNTVNNLYYYQQMIKDEINVFLEKGWRNGVYEMSLRKHLLKLELIEQRVGLEITGKNSKKTLNHLQEQRIRVLGRYNEIKNKKDENTL